MRKNLYSRLALPIIVLVAGETFMYFFHPWVNKSPPVSTVVPLNQQNYLIHYGRQLIEHTGRYFGPKGTVSRMTNGMNCNNCHLEAGTRFLANDFSRVASGYPVFRNRSGTIETVEMRVNDCFERSLNGKALRDTSMEMKAIVAYLNSLGKKSTGVSGKKGPGIEKLSFLNRAADPVKGEQVFNAVCQSCHGKNGEGKWDTITNQFLYPPLWGKYSYNVGAGIYQLSKFAGFVKDNMPFGITYQKPFLNNEQAWDVAAFVNSKPRPWYKNLKNDWPVSATKPVDYPFGPYADQFSEAQHKYGPFMPILSQQEKQKSRNVADRH